jgi:hypothetical protein
MTHPRAADDFTVIRKRIEELRRESVSAPAESQARPLAPQPYHLVGAGSEDADPRRLPRAIRQKLFR